MTYLNVEPDSLGMGDQAIADRAPSGTPGLTRAEAVAKGLDPDMDLRATPCPEFSGLSPETPGDNRPPRVYLGAMNRELAKFPELAAEFGDTTVRNCREAARFLALSNERREQHPEPEVLPQGAAAGAEPEALEEKIFNGTVTSRSGLVVLTQLGASTPMTCTGFVVSARHVMTAAHCLNGTQNDTASLTSASGSTWSGTVFTYVHPDFSGSLGGGGTATDSYDDVGIIVLQGSDWAYANSTTNRLRLWAGSTSNGQLLNIYGAGLNGDTASATANTVRLPPSGAQVDVDYNAGNGYFLNDAPSGARTCAGDSGGPAIKADQSYEVAYGVFSNADRSTNCTPTGNKQRWTKVAPKVVWAEASMRPMFGASFSCGQYNNGWGLYYRCW